MKSYARIDNGLFVELIAPMVYDAEDPSWTEGQPSRIGQEVPIELRFTPEFVSWLVEITDLDPMPQVGWTYIDGVFAPWAPNPQDVLAANRAEQASLIAQASQVMAPILVSLQLGDPTDAETVRAKAWQAYYRALTAVDVTVVNPSWPVQPSA